MSTITCFCAQINPSNKEKYAMNKNTRQPNKTKSMRFFKYHTYSQTSKNKLKSLFFCCYFIASFFKGISIQNNRKKSKTKQKYKLLPIGVRLNCSMLGLNCKVKCASVNLGKNVAG